MCCIHGAWYVWSFDVCNNDGSEDNDGGGRISGVWGCFMCDV